MRLSAFRDGTTVQVAVLVGDRLAPLAPVDDFYADLGRWSARASEVTAGAVSAGAVPAGAVPIGDVTQVPAVPPTAKVLCVGLNYKAHADEGGRDLPTHPNIFARWASTLAADGDDVPLPAAEPGLDFEAELVAVVGTELRGVDAPTAGAGIFGYACGNDITARGYQHRTAQWALGKNPDGSGPMGPIVTADEVGELAPLAISCRLNGVEMQRSTLGHMVFAPDAILAYASGCCTLQPGDVVFTGTPAGVGFRRTPPVFMGDGDEVEVVIEGVGRIVNRIVAKGGPT